MTKSDLTTYLTGIISAVVNITKHRNANNGIVDEIYPTPVNDTYLTETYTTKSANANLHYDIRLNKTGRKVNISGNITNTGGVVVPVPTIFTFKNNEFMPETNIVRGKATNVSNSDIIILVSDTGFKIGGSLPTPQAYYFNITYNAKD